jgi:hypothetical protein
MAQFPKLEADIIALANSMIAGYGAHAADFPCSNALSLIKALTDFNKTKIAQIDALAAAQVATESKNLKLADLEEKMKDELQMSEVDVGSDSEKLGYIGWGLKAPLSPADPPGQPRNLDLVALGAGSIFLDWKAPARGSSGAVRYYVIERREQPAGGGVFGSWAQVGIALETEATLIDQPCGQQLEYRIKAVNAGGESISSNTMAVEQQSMLPKKGVAVGLQ